MISLLSFVDGRLGLLKINSKKIQIIIEYFSSLVVYTVFYLNPVIRNDVNFQWHGFKQNSPIATKL